MSEMVERVASAIERFNLDKGSDAYDDNLALAVCAAFKAMQEPDAAMIEAFERVVSGFDFSVSSDARRAVDLWGNMIDAALK